MTEALMLPEVRQLRPPGALLTVALPVVAPLDETSPPLVLVPLPELLLPLELRKSVEIQPLELPQTTGCQPPDARPRSETEVPSERTVMIDELVLAAERQRTPSPLVPLTYALLESEA